ncbi:hypothetical protein GCM10009719_25690 [Nocardioides kribbensis]
MQKMTRMPTWRAVVVASVLIATASTGTAVGAMPDEVSPRAARRTVAMQCDGPGRLVLVTKVQGDARVAAWIKGLDLPHDALWTYRLTMVSDTGASASIESSQRAEDGEWASGRLISRGTKSLTIRGKVATKSGSRECKHAITVRR